MLRKLVWTTLFTALFSTVTGCTNKAPEYPVGSSLGGSGDMLGLSMIARDNPGVYVEVSPAQSRPSMKRTDLATVPND
jgi:hypothetical protein